MKNYDCLIYFDGSCIPNPGKMEIAIVGIPKNGPYFLERYEIGHGTNNIAEWSSAILAIEMSIQKQYKRIKILGDSQLVINQLSGSWRVKDPYLKQLYMHAIKSSTQLRSIDCEWTPRNDNLAGIYFEEGRYKVESLLEKRHFSLTYTFD